MNAVQVEQKSYEMPPKDGLSIAHFLTVADVERSARYYEKVFGARAGGPGLNLGCPIFAQSYRAKVGSALPKAGVKPEGRND